ncbi:hypothetical protein BDV06DRAFT_225422 [Aspergillus oleicola]
MLSQESGEVSEPLSNHGRRTQPKPCPWCCKRLLELDYNVSNSEEEADRAGYRQVLSQVNWCMRQHKARYGFVITDKELVVLRRVDDGGTGNLELAAPIRFTTAGTAARPQLTDLLARGPPPLQLEQPEECLNYGIADLDDVVPSEITFQKKLAASEFAYVFLVTNCGQGCVMKHHGRGPWEDYEPDRELDIHVLEATAYCRMKYKGLCDKGIVPRFLDSMRKFDPAPCLPQLRRFHRGE